MNIRRWTACVWVAAWMLPPCMIAACGGDDNGTNTDTTPDAGTTGDSSAVVADARPGDTGTGDSTTLDAGTDATVLDSGLDADAGARATDGGPDTSAPADADASGADVSDAQFDAVFDAAGNADVVTTIEILSTLGPPDTDGGSQCLTCAMQSRCLDPNLLCEHLQGTITAGPGVGQSREAICAQTLSCVISSGCFAGGIDACLCGNEDDPTCIDAGPQADGGCLGVEEMGLETADTATALQTLTYTTLSAGTANAQVGCLVNAGCGACFVP